MPVGAAPILRIELQREHSDCAIAALAMYFGESYEDVLRIATLTDRSQARRGLWTRTLQRIASRMGRRLIVRRKFDWDEAYGVLRLPDHAAVLWNGLVINTDATVWDADAFLASRGFQRNHCLLLVVEDE